MIKIRAHHIQCIPRFYHGGFNKKFADNMKKICLQFRKNPNTNIRVIVEKFDDICEKCLYKSKKECTHSEEVGKWVIFQDKKIAKYLKLKHNKIYTARELFNLSLDKINEKTINTVCKNCIFLENCIKIGVNKSFKKDLNKKKRL